MVTIRYATTEDIPFWMTLDGHIDAAVLKRKLDARECYLALEDGNPVGILRYGLFWDNTPFCNMIYFADEHRGKGYGRLLMRRWESDMAERGFEAVMVSTQADECAQFFYRKLGYVDCGALVLNAPPFSQPPELFLLKTL